MNAIESIHPEELGWRQPLKLPSLPEVFGSISVPRGGPSWRRLLAFAGPGYLVAVGYMDPGNWATDISGGAAYSYRLLSVIFASNLMAIFLQILAAKLGMVTGRDLAQACRDSYPRPVVWCLWLSAEIGIIACDVAEVIGSAIALNLLFHIPMVWGVAITGLDVLLVLALQGRGFRIIEGMVMTLIVTMMVIFSLELYYSGPDWGGVALGFIPTLDIVRDPKMLYIALGILGATVMPHNLYLHSSIVQTRRHGRDHQELGKCLKMAYTDSTVALTLALFVNAAILILAADAFYRSGNHEVGDIQQAYELLTPLLGAALATPLFAVALLASGQNATLTGTLAGQIVLEGFINFKLAPWACRLISRSIAIVPAILAVAFFGEKGTGQLLVFSQVVLSIQLPFAVIPLLHFTSDKSKMGAFVNGFWVKLVGALVAVGIVVLNGYLIGLSLTGN